jgi:hypothetical protein
MTKANGVWNNAGSWVNANIPPFTYSDTIIIKHLILLPSDLTLLSGAFLNIDSTGGLCGHYKINMSASTSLLKYGFLQIDALNMTGGEVNLLPPGNTIFTQYGLLTGGVFNNTSNFNVGPWFQCQLPEYQFINGLNNEDKNAEFLFYPNPVECLLNIVLPKSGNPFLCFIYDIKGALVLKEKVFYHQPVIDVSELPAGIYYIDLTANEIKFISKFRKN